MLFQNSRSRPVLPESDRLELSRQLAREIRGEVRFDEGSLALYATDASNYRQIPIGVVLPKDRDDLIAAVGVCRRFGAPIVSRGGGTSLAGQACNAAVVIDTSKYFHHILQIDPERRRATVEPGVVLNELNRAASRHGLTFGPDPASRSQCTLGGMIGNDSCGVHSVMAAFAGEGPKTADNVAELEVLTYDGARLRVGETSQEDLSRASAEDGRRAEIYRGLAALRDQYAPLIRARYPDIPRRVSGYNLPYLLPEKGMHVARALVGSEGTCVTVLEATLHLIESPAARALCVSGFSDVYAAAQAVTQVLTHRPIGLEGFDDRLVADTRAVGANAAGLELLPRGNGWLVIEIGRNHERRSESPRAAARDRPAPHRRRRFARLHRRRAAGLGLERARVRARSHLPRARPPEPVGRMGRLRRPAGKARRLHARPSRAPRTIRIRRRVLRTLRRRAASTRGSISTSRRARGSRPSGRFSTTRPTSSSPMAARSPASTATGRRGRSSCRRCSGRSSSKRFASSNGSGIPRAR